MNRFTPYLICIILVIASLAVVVRQYDQQSALRWRARAYRDLVLEQSRIESMGRALELAYDMSECEAWTRAQIYRHFEKRFKISWMKYGGVAWTESRFERYPLSHKGAISEMQVMDIIGTAEMRTKLRDACDKLKIRYKKGDTLKDQIRNIWIGCTILSLLIVDKGDSLGMVRYNGEGREAYEFEISVRGEVAKLREIYSIINPETKGNQWTQNNLTR